MQLAYDTLSQAIEALKALGYVQDFNLTETCIECSSLAKSIQPDEFEVDEVYRFEGMTNPDDSSVLYAITSSHHGIKGLLVDAYGAYSSPLNAEMIEKLRYRPNA